MEICCDVVRVFYRFILRIFECIFLFIGFQLLALEVCFPWIVKITTIHDDLSNCQHPNGNGQNLCGSY